MNFSFAEEPLDLILLFDTAGSMHAKLLGKWSGPRNSASTSFAQEADRVSVRVFSSTSTEMLPFSDNLEKVNQAILLKALTIRPSGIVPAGTGRR